MKLSIEGFSQAYAATLKKEIHQADGSTKTIRIDCTDLVLLRWFVDFYPAMKKKQFEDGEYAWVLHRKLKDDMPMLDISTRAFSERMQKFIYFDILKYRCVKDSDGTACYYAFGENYKHMISQDPVQFEEHPRCSSNDTPGVARTTPKDKSIIYESINDTIKESERESRQKASPARHKHGEYQNVLLSDEELAKLNEEYGEDVVKIYIERVSSYMASKGATYKNFLATIRNWIKRDAERANNNNAAMGVPQEEGTFWERVDAIARGEK